MWYIFRKYVRWSVSFDPSVISRKQYPTVSASKKRNENEFLPRLPMCLLLKIFHVCKSWPWQSQMRKPHTPPEFPIERIPFAISRSTPSSSSQPRLRSRNVINMPSATVNTSPSIIFCRLRRVPYLSLSSPRGFFRLAGYEKSISITLASTTNRADRIIPDLSLT